MKTYVKQNKTNTCYHPCPVWPFILLAFITLVIFRKWDWNFTHFQMKVVFIMSKNIALLYCSISKILHFPTPYFFETTSISKVQFCLIASKYLTHVLCIYNTPLIPYLLNNIISMFIEAVTLIESIETLCTRVDTWIIRCLPVQ